MASPDIYHIAQLALVIAGVDVARHRPVIAEMHARLNKGTARRRRDIALREACDILAAGGGDSKMLARALAKYRANTWPSVRHLVEPPADLPLRAAFWRACRAAEDADINLPAYRQLRRIVE
mgnify:FL=1